MEHYPVLFGEPQGSLRRQDLANAERRIGKEAGAADSCTEAGSARPAAATGDRGDERRL
jgi:hypothetical protein